MDFDIIVLAGGRSRRMGRDKAAISLAGTPLLERVVAAAWSWGAGDVLVVGPAREWLPARYVADVPGFAPSSLLGMYSGIRASRRPWQLVMGCDMPFVSSKVVELLWQHKNAAGAVAVWHNRLQPLPGLYPASAAAIIEELLNQKRFHLAAVIDRLAPAVVEAQQVAAVDPDGASFFNINSRDDLEAARRYLP